MPSLLKIMFKMFFYRILTHFADEVSQLAVDCVQFSSRLYLTVLFSIRFKSVSTRAPGSRATCHLTDFNETLAV